MSMSDFIITKYYYSRYIMLRAVNKSEKSFLAFDTNKDEKPFYCPACMGEVVLKKGNVKIHHFAHKPDASCDYGKGESELHYRTKIEIYESLKQQPNCRKCEIERHLGTVRPDISLYVNDIPVAIEIQKSNISIPIIIKRMEEYTKKGIAVVWVIPAIGPVVKWHYAAAQSLCYPSKWELYLHSLFGNRLYFYYGEDALFPYKYNNVEISNFFSGCSDVAKKLKKPLSLFRTASISKDFEVVKRPRVNLYDWDYEFPECLLFRDVSKASDFS